MKHSLTRTLKQWLRLNLEAKKESASEDKNVRRHLTEQQIDKTLADSFPASDPPPH